MAKHHETHPEYVEGCNPCRWSTVYVGPTSDVDRTQHKAYRLREADLHRYRDKRKAGEQPDGTTRESMELSEKKQQLWNDSERQISDDNPTELVTQTKKSLTNQ